jgi:hypothetical protein
MDDKHVNFQKEKRKDEMGEKKGINFYSIFMLLGVLMLLSIIIGVIYLNIKINTEIRTLETSIKSNVANIAAETDNNIKDFR